MNKLLILLFLPFFINAFAQKPASGKEKVSAINEKWEEEVLQFTNLEREKRGLKPLQWNKQLTFASRYHAKDMAVNNYFDHDSFYRTKKGSLKHVCGTFDRMEAFINFNAMGENISAGRNSAKATVKAWMDSKGHRENILNKDFTEIGVGYYYLEDSEYGHYWVQNFGGK
ncbi:MAG: secretion protein [Bacteroidetes bacterium 4572_77]|nr:MAG: secretion protein [Bacteroidetes bacterium 4572_77]